jgi:D-amino-acid dehydrogenase
MYKDPTRAITVIGAGMVGVSCALYLQREGFKVTLIDRAGPGEASSGGNAGSLGIASIMPEGTPGLLKRVPRMLIDRSSALKIKWSYLPFLAPWLIRLIRNSTRARVEEIAAARHQLLARTFSAYEPLLADARAHDLVRRVGKFQAYEHEATFRTTQYQYELCRRHGIKMEVLDGNQARDREPALGPRIQRAVYLPDVHYVANPERLVKAFAQAFIDGGGTLVRDEVRDFVIAEDGPTEIVAASARYPIAEMVIASGSWSGRLAARLGSKLPIEAERGYHAMITAPGVEFKHPVTLMDRHIALTPMEDGLRICGIAEFAGLDAPPKMSHIDMVVRNAEEVIPGLKGRIVSRWSGSRPSLPDSLPAIGRHQRFRNVYYACGHDHLGLTMGPITGRLIAQMAANRQPELDLSPYRPDRFENQAAKGS